MSKKFVPVVLMCLVTGLFSFKEKKFVNGSDAVITFYPTTAVDSIEEFSQILPSFMVVDMNGNTTNINGLKGKTVFVNLWATWCPPCRREIPSIEKLAASVDTAKVIFVLISLDNNFETAKRFAKKQKFSLPLYYPAESLPRVFAVQAIPSTFVFDKSGTLVRFVEGSEDYNTEEYKKLLK